MSKPTSHNTTVTASTSIWTVSQPETSAPFTASQAPRVQIEGIDREQGGQAIHRQRRCLDMACPLRCRRDLICLQNNIFGVSATRGVDRHDRWAFDNACVAASECAVAAECAT